MATARPPAVFKQGLGDAAGQQLGPAQGIVGGDDVEGLDHAQHRAHQPQQRADVGHAVEHAEVAAEVVGDPLAAVDGRLLDLDGRAGPTCAPPRRRPGPPGCRSARTGPGPARRSSSPSRSCSRNRVTNGLGMTRPRRRLIARSSTNVTTRNEQPARAIISGPPSTSTRQRSWWGWSRRTVAAAARRSDGRRRRGPGQAAGCGGSAGRA